MGRKPVPTALKILRGNPGKKPLPKGEPQPPADNIVRPSYLGKVARRKWDELLPLLQSVRVMTRADIDALARLCDTYEWWLAIREKLRKEGESYPVLNDKGEVKYVAQRPEVAIAHKLAAQLHTLEADFGLNPASRTKLDVVPPSSGNPIDALRARKAALYGNQEPDALEEFFAQHG
jgi:P27 family predicted phage terminase small subunit